MCSFPKLKSVFAYVVDLTMGLIMVLERLQLLWFEVQVTDEDTSKYRTNIFFIFNKEIIGIWPLFLSYKNCSYNFKKTEEMQITDKLYEKDRRI